MVPRKITPPRAGVAGWLLFCLLSILCPTARADDLDGAQRHFERAVRLYQERAYDGALAEFQRAFEISPHYQLLFNIGQVHYQLNEYAEALGAFERYLSEGGDQVPAERRQFVQQELADLRERVGTLVVVSEPVGASVLLDDAELGVTPLTPVRVDIGRHVLRVELPGYRAMARRINISSGEVAHLELELQRSGSELVAATVRAEPGAARDGGGRRAALWTLGSLASALAVGAGTSLALAYAADRDLDQQLSELPPDARAIAHDRTRIERAALASDVLGVAALATGSALVITLIAARPRPHEARAQRGPARGLTMRLEAGPSALRMRGTF
jgi:tetratricopeptide (TPR) repeat protein